MSRRGVILLCCLLSACEREDARSAAQQAAKSTAREPAGEIAGSADERLMKSRRAEWESKVRTEETAAAKDADLQKLFQEMLPADPFGDMPPEPDRDAIATLYGARYPHAGIRWLMSLGKEDKTPWWHFAKAWYAADLQAAFGMIDNLPLMARNEFADGLCQAANATDRERLWEMTSGSDSNFSNATGLQGRLITNQARRDPAGAWQMAQERMGRRYDEERFLDSLHNLDPQTPYPASFLDRIDPARLSEVINMGLHASRSRVNVEPLAQWIAAQPPSPELEDVYENMAGWEGAYGDPIKARQWAEKITAPERRERAIRDLPKDAIR